jgi:hypothetical protein
LCFAPYSAATWTSCAGRGLIAIWDWLVGSLCMPPVELPGLAFGVSGHAHDPHGVMGLVVDPVVNAFKALIASCPFRRTAGPTRNP